MSEFKFPKLEFYSTTETLKLFPQCKECSYHLCPGCKRIMCRPIDRRMKYSGVTIERRVESTRRKYCRSFSEWPKYVFDQEFWCVECWSKQK